LIHEAVIAHEGMTEWVKPHTFFNPVDWFNFRVLFRPTPLPEEAYAVHLCGEMWRRSGINPETVFAKDSLYEVLKLRFL